MTGCKFGPNLRRDFVILSVEAADCLSRDYSRHSCVTDHLFRNITLTQASTDAALSVSERGVPADSRGAGS